MERYLFNPAGAYILVKILDIFEKSLPNIVSETKLSVKSDAYFKARALTNCVHKSKGISGIVW